MGQHDDAQRGQEPAPKGQHRAETDEEALTGDVPSTEAEIEPGVNQDASAGESFSSEPAHEAAGEDRDT